VVVAGRRFSPAASAFVNSVKAHGWPESAIPQALRKTAA
jgi:hypothetical protein